MKWNSHSVKMNTVPSLIISWFWFYFCTLNDIWHFSESEVKVIPVLVQNLYCVKYWNENIQPLYTGT